MKTIWPRIRFLGAARTVTGSKYLLTYGEKNILVDCGLFQGLKELRLKNWDRFPIDPASISAAVLTHAHIDHSGYLPRLVKEGFRGPIFSTPATADLCRIILMDAAYLNEEEAKFLNEKGLSKHRPARPLFSHEDVHECLKLFRTKEFDEPFAVDEDFRATFHYAGHILGAASIVVEVGGKKIGFSGDLGRARDEIMNAPAPPSPTEELVVESTYGDRVHSGESSREVLKKIVRQAHEEGGVVLIPAFAVGRAQTVMHLLSELRKSGEIPAIPIFLNSPMATDVTDLLGRFRSIHHLTEKECREMNATIQFVRSVEESKALNSRKGAMVIVSASGMLTGGRILHHLKEFGPKPSTHLVFTGYQAVGTRGRALLEGAETLDLFGESVPIRAKVHRLDNLSAHADSAEILDWLAQLETPPKRVFITHGEEAAARALKAQIEMKFGWNCEIPNQDQEFALR